MKKKETEAPYIILKLGLTIEKKIRTDLAIVHRCLFIHRYKSYVRTKHISRVYIFLVEILLRPFLSVSFSSHAAKQTNK